MMNDYTPKNIVDVDNNATKIFERRDTKGLLPNWLQTNKNMARFFDSVVNIWFQPAYETRVTGFIGQKVRDLNSEDYYINETTDERTFYQLEPGTTILDGNGDLSAVESYVDCINELKVQGANTNNHDRLFNTDFWCWSPPINIDMFINYYNYYWVETGPKVIEITEPTNVILNIIGKQYFILNLLTGGTLEFQSGQKVIFRNDANLEYNDIPFIVDNVGRSIMLIDNTPFENSSETSPDYIVMERGAIDDNQWSYVNRWFHKEQIHREDNIQQEFKQASRPIICFERDIKLRDSGTFFRKEVDVVLYGSKASIENTLTSVDGVNLIDGMRVLVLGDPTPEVNNKIYKVAGIDQFGYIILIIENDGLDETGNSVYGESVRVKLGDLYKNTNFHYDGNNWNQSQIKSKKNQQPLFELYDFNKVRLDDQGVYPESSFHGNGIFGYATDNNGEIDPVLGINIKYNDMGNIVFDNLCETQIYQYYIDEKWKNIDGMMFYKFNKTMPIFSASAPIKTEAGLIWYDITNSGYKVLNNDLVWNSITYISNIAPIVSGSEANLIWWDTEYANFKKIDPRTQTWYVYIDNPDEYHSDWNYSNWNTRQLVSQEYTVAKNQLPNGSYEIKRYYEIEHFPQDYVQNEPINKFLFINNSQKKYGTEWEITAENKLHIFDNVQLNERDSIELKTYDKDSVQELKDSHYNIPNNLQSNPNNNNILEVSYDELFNHFISIISNQDDLVGQPYGENNYRSTPRDLSKGTEILSYNSPMLKLMILNKLDYTKTRSVIDLIRNRYLNYRGKLSQTITAMINHNEITESDSLTQDSIGNAIKKIFERMDLGKNESFPFYNTGMIENGFMPATPSFLGMHPLFKPQVALVSEYPTPKNMLQCHDGSYENLYGDYIEQEIAPSVYAYRLTDWRDTFMINIEDQIYNNTLDKFKKEPVEYGWYNIIPGKFRKTGYTTNDYFKITQPIFEKWVIENNVNYRENTGYSPTDWKTWNWSLLTDKDGQSLLGHYRGIYRYYFDTERPHTHPWEMFGFGEQPEWWEGKYGSAPMTSQNHEFWNDVKLGYIAGGRFMGYDKRFARPDIFDYIPVDDMGNLISPFSAGITDKQPVETQANIPWKYGDGSLYEWFWWYTSSFCFDLQSMSYILNPVNWLEKNWDTENLEVVFRYTKYQQTIYSNLHKRSSSSDIIVHNELDENGNYIKVIGNSQWYSASVRNNGQDITNYIGNPLRTMKPQLTYKSGSYIRQDSISFVSDIAGLIPKTNVNVLFNKSAVIKQYYYSALVIGWNGSNFTISGYNPIESSITIKDVYNTGSGNKISINGVDSVIYTKFKQSYTTIQYGQTLSTIQDVVNAITGYGKWLEEQGWLFNVYDDENSEMIDWTKSTKDFLGWVSNPLEEGDLTVLNPGYGKLTLLSEHGQIDDMTHFVNGTWLLLDINQFPISDENIEIYREGSSVSIETKTSMIGYMRVCAVEYEHIVVFDNETTFGKVIYDPTYNIRQPRLRTFYTKTEMWDGTLFAPGYVIKNNGTVPNFEKNANDIRYYYDTDNVANAGIIEEHAKSLIGYVDKDYMQELLLDEKVMFDFYKGYIREKGTASVFSKLMRSTYLMTPGDFKIYEDWLFKIGEYGATDYKNYIEFNIKQEDLKANPQAVYYSSDAFLNDTDNDVVEISRKDSRWIKKSLIAKNDMFVNRDFKTDGYNDLPTGGFARMGDSKYTVANRDELETFWASSEKKLRPNDYIWLVNDIDGSWNMFKTILVGNIVEVVSQGEEEIVGNDLAIIRVDRPIYLNVGDKIIITAATYSKPIIDGYQTVYGLGEGVTDAFIVNTPMLEGCVYDEMSDKPMILKLVSMKISAVNDLPNYITQVIYTDDFSSNTGWTLGTDISISGNKLNFNVVPVKSQDIGIGDDIEVAFTATLTYIPVLSVEGIKNNGVNLTDFEIDFSTGNITADELDPSQTNHLDLNTGDITITFIDPPVSNHVISIDYYGDVRYAYKDIFANVGNSYKIEYTMTDYTEGRLKSRLGDTENWTDHSFVSRPFVETTFVDYITATDNGIIRFSTDVAEGFIGSISNLTITEYKMMTLDDNDKIYVLKDKLTMPDNTLKPIINDPNNVASTSDYINQRLWTVFNYDTGILDWILARIENDRVNSYTIDDIYLFSKNDLHTMAKLITFDPIKNILDGRAMTEIALTLSYDPAKYIDFNNLSNERISPWFNKNTGKIWWDLSKVRYIDYEQGDLVYRKKYWGKQLPGSEIALYEWTRSPVKPEDWASFIEDSSATKDLGYEPSGEPRTVVVDGELITPFNEREEWNNATNSYETCYYFWVKNPINVPPHDFRKISTMQAKKLLESPQREGVMWFAPIYSGFDGAYYDSSFVISNCGSIITDDNTIVQINFKKDGTRDLNVHKQWELIRDNFNGTIPPSLWSKMKDSLVGFDRTGKTVPDIKLDESVRYGNNIRPRQSWFKDINSAREVFILTINNLFQGSNLIGFGVSGDSSNDRSFNNTFYSFDPIPAETEYDYETQTISERNYLYQNEVGNNKKVLVHYDSTEHGRWTISTWNNTTNTWTLNQKQLYIMTDYWSPIDWYNTEEGICESTIPIYEIESFADRGSLTGLKENDIVKIKNGNSNEANPLWILQRYNIVNGNDSWSSVGVEDGTLTFNNVLYNLDETNSFKVREYATVIGILVDYFDSIRGE